MRFHAPAFWGGAGRFPVHGRRTGWDLTAVGLCVLYQARDLGFDSKLRTDISSWLKKTYREHIMGSVQDEFAKQQKSPKGAASSELSLRFPCPLLRFKKEN